jgi:hypothetical protein
MSLSLNAKPNPKAAAWLLRLGLAAIFAYAALGSLLHPLEWVSFLPAWLTAHVNGRTLVGVFAIYEALLVVWLLSGRYLRYAALMCALTLAAIVLMDPSQLIVTFRDVGLVFAALALAILSA